MSSILHPSASPVQSDLVSQADLDWHASQHDDWHDQFAVKQCGDTDFDCSLDFEEEHRIEVERWFQRHRIDPTGDDMPDECYRFGGYPT